MPSPVLSARAARALPVALLCAACGSVPVRGPVMRPAEINMVAYQSVAVGDVRGGRGTAVMGDSLEEALLGTNRFQVLDRQHMSSIMRELSLSASDLADPTKAAKLGKVMTAGALIYGDVDEQYREIPSEDRIKNKDGSVVMLYRLRGELRTRATFKIVDVATGRLIIAKTYWILGLAYEYAGEYDSATATVQKAYELSNDKDMLRELDNIRRLQDEAKRLSEQTAAPGVGGVQ